MTCKGSLQRVSGSSLVAARYLLWLLLACSAAAAPSSSLAAQVPELIVASDTLLAIQLMDESRLVGRVVQVVGDRITVETTAGVRVELTRDQIRSLRPIRGTVRDGEVWLEDPNTARLFIAPTGRTLRKGHGYVGVSELVFPFASYGVTDWLTLAAVTPIAPASVQGVFVTPRVRLLALPSAQVSAGALAYFYDSGSIGILYGVVTLGGTDRAVTVGSGLPFVTQQESAVADEPILMAGGELRLGRRGKLITENHFWLGENPGLLSAGIRVFGERFAVDLALGLLLADFGEGEQLCCLPVPLVNVVYNFAVRR